MASEQVTSVLILLAIAIEFRTVIILRRNLPKLTKERTSISAREKVQSLMMLPKFSHFPHRRQPHLFY